MVCFGSRTSQVQILPPRLDCRVDCDEGHSPTPSSSVLPVCYLVSSSTAWAVLTLVVALCFFTGPELSNAASPVSPASRSVGISSIDLATTQVRVRANAARGPERGVAADTPRATIFKRRANVIRSVFGAHGAAAIRVAKCESGPSLNPKARNGQYLGAFQMGDAERRRFGHGPGVRHQSLAAWRYFRLAGWRPWSCAYRV
jgi:hypothetical protein